MAELKQRMPEPSTHQQSEPHWSVRTYHTRRSTCIAAVLPALPSPACARLCQLRVAHLLHDLALMTGTVNELSMTAGDQRRNGAGFFAGWVTLAALLCAAGAMACAGTTDEPTDCHGLDCRPERQCRQGLATYADGASRPAGDGCNTCTCTGGGWSCTALGCAGNSCVYEGQIRTDGSSFPASDGCNQCTCSDGIVACTERGCVPPGCLYDGVLLPSGATAPAGDGCNSCSCIGGQLACTFIACLDSCYGDSDCRASQYCAFPVGTCPDVALAASNDAETEELRAPSGQLPLPAGECRDRPALCTEEPSQVCGCDGQTYRSACAAASLGLSLASTGPCSQGN